MEDWGDVIMFTFLCNESCSSILKSLQTINLVNIDTSQGRIAKVQTRSNKSVDKADGGFVSKKMVTQRQISRATNVTNMVKVGSSLTLRYLIDFWKEMEESKIWIVYMSTWFIRDAVPIVNISVLSLFNINLLLSIHPMTALIQFWTHSLEAMKLLGKLKWDISCFVSILVKLAIIREQNFRKRLRIKSE